MKNTTHHAVENKPATATGEQQSSDWFAQVSEAARQLNIPLPTESIAPAEAEQCLEQWEQEGGE